VTGIPTDSANQESFEVVTRHSFFWLLISCLTGLLLAFLLLVPSFGAILQPYSYGRWVSVHLNASLYGWSSVPLLGLLFMQYLPVTRISRLPVYAVSIWSGVLLFAMIGWLSGHTSGKLFMEWSGASRWAILLGMCLLAFTLWVSLIQRIREGRAESSDTLYGRLFIGMKLFALLLLSSIPFIMYAAASPALYPPVNPDSGGATGGSLLGSTLGIVFIYWMTPFVLRLNFITRISAFIPSLILLILHFSAFALLDHGDRSHHERIQIISLSSLIIWIPLLIRHLRRFEWPDGSRLWLMAFAGWGVTLTLNGILSFLPHILEAWKFTNALVAHVHIAMAGMITSFNMLVLVVINQRTSLKEAFSSRSRFWLWQGGTVLHAVSLLIVGTLESMHPAWLFTGHIAMNTLYTTRLIAGIIMVIAAVGWFRQAHCGKEKMYEKN